jgi:hypothetical protein
MPADSNIYKVYWDGKLTGEEKEWVKDIKKLYGVRNQLSSDGLVAVEDVRRHQRRCADVSGVSTH